MKKNQKNSTGILLVAVQTEKNQKQKRIENFIDGLLVWIFAMLTGIARLQHVWNKGKCTACHCRNCVCGVSFF